MWRYMWWNISILSKIVRLHWKTSLIHMLYLVGLKFITIPKTSFGFLFCSLPLFSFSSMTVLLNFRRVTHFYSVVITHKASAVRRTIPSMHYSSSVDCQRRVPTKQTMLSWQLTKAWLPGEISLSLHTISWSQIMIANMGRYGTGLL